MSIKQGIVTLIENNKEKFYRIAFAYVKNKEDALDIFHNAIVKALQGYHSLRKIEFLETWFCRILIHESITFLRKNRKVFSLEELTDAQLPAYLDPAEEYIDLLFYHLNLHCYVVVEVKIKEFKSRDIGQIGTYINIVDDIVKMDSDGKTIGLIICKEKNNVLAKYAVNSSNEPIAISAYELSNFLPENLATLLPSTDELESRLLLDEAVNENDNNNQ